jgi:predicted transglutaminase-like cysteine proteinase
MSAPLAAPVFGAFVGLPFRKAHPEWTRIAGAGLSHDQAAPTRIGIDVNGWVNGSIRYTPDAQDHWQTPAETLARRAGDCEDLAILKRAILIARGMPAERAWIVVGHDLVRRQAHAVLLAHGRVFDCVCDVTLDPERLEDVFTPMFAYGAGAWLFGRKA